MERKRKKYPLTRARKWKNKIQNLLKKEIKKVEVKALPGGSSSNAEVTKTKRTPKPRRSKFENLSEADSCKRQSSRISHLQELKQKQEVAERKRQRDKEKGEERKRLKVEEESERRKRKEDTEKYLNFVVDMTPQYAVLPGKRQRMFRQAAIMLMNELLNEQEAEETCLDN